MYLKKIQIENFQSYYGKDEELPFDKNLNLILGTIGAGKSKLFNAFYWNLFGDIYKNQGGWVHVDSSNFLCVFNKKSLKETEVNDIVKVSVKLEIKAEKDYSVQHSIEIKKIGDADFNSQSDWKFINEETIIKFDNTEGNTIVIDNPHDVREYIDKKLLPIHISKYLWFQGETLDELIDISNGQTFKNAINFISYIGYYDHCIGLVDTLIDKTEKKLRREKRNDTSNERDFNRISGEIELIERRIENKKEEIENNTKEIDAIKRSIEEIDKRLDDIDEYIELKKKKDKLDQELKSIMIEIENLDKNKSNIFSKSWLMLGTKTLLKEGFDKLLTCQKWYQEKKNENPTGLPYDVPLPDYLDDMRRDKICYICGRKFKQSDDADQYIKNRIEIARGEIKEVIKKNKEYLDFNNNVVELLSSKNSVISNVESIKSSIDDFLSRNQELNSRKSEIIEQSRDINGKITALQKKHGNKITDKFSTEKNKYNYNISEKENISGKLQRLKYQLLEMKSEITEKKSQLDKIPPITDKDYIEETYLTYLNYLHKLIIKTKDAEFQKLINKIESKANEILDRTTRANRVINGKIQIDRDDFTIKLVDLDYVNGERDLNTGHLTLMKMCIINAIVIISNEYKNKSYPFIADAPTSDLDDGTTILYYKVLDEEYEQSIIMTKDLFEFKAGRNVVDKQFLKEQEFSNVSVIEKGGAEENLTETNSYSVIKKII